MSDGDSDPTGEIGEQNQDGESGQQDAVDEGGDGGEEVGKEKLKVTVHLIVPIICLLIGVAMIVLAWILPSVTLGAGITFTLLGVLLVIVAIVHLINRTLLTQTICGLCPPIAM
jgi:hypothetical protein